MAQASPDHIALHAPGVDAHAHLDDPCFDADRAEVLAKARSRGVGTVVLAAGDPRHWRRVRAVAQQHGLPFALGVHPWWPDPEAMSELPALLDGACAVGETGLDYLRTDDDEGREQQAALLEAHLHLASRQGLPVVLHHVRATGDVLDAVEASEVRSGVLHAFVRGDVERAVALGLHLSFGTDLFRSHRARSAAARVPLDRLLLESDAPHRPPSGDRGQPALVADLADIVAEERGMDPRDVLSCAGDNARRLFGLGEAPR